MCNNVRLEHHFCIPCGIAKPQSILLRPATHADLPALFEFQLDPESNRLAGVIPRSRDGFDALWQKILADTSTVVRIIMADDDVVGHISGFNLDGHLAVGYWIARSHWNRGIATAALKQFVELVPTRPLYARVARHNAASMKVLQRCGFVVTGYQTSPGTERYLECEEALMLLH